MKVFLVCLGKHASRRMRKKLRTITDARTRIRFLIILNLDKGKSASEVADAVEVARSTVYRVLRQFERHGQAGLEDRRKENGSRKVDERYRQTLRDVVASSPLKHDWRRPTWTLEMLIETMREITGFRVSLATMSRVLTEIQARRGRPKPTVGCPWSPQKKGRRLAEIRRLLDDLPADEVAYYEDEVDIHLNPKIGLDWMVRGQQKEVETPGVNEKRYLAGARNVRTGVIVWEEAESKNSYLFLHLLWKLAMRHRAAPRIHVILDNYSIHSSHIVQRALRTTEGRRIVLHFLPPYCPDHNKIERDWQDLHAEVTRNHCCSTMEELLVEVRDYLSWRNEQEFQSYYQLVA